MHDDKIKYEYYAIQCLRKFYPEFTDVIKGESPDFYSSDCKLGIEIVRAENEDTKRRYNQIVRLYSQNLTEEQQKKMIKRISYQTSAAFYDPCTEPKVEYLKKRALLNRPHFKIFNSNYLVILATLDHFIEEKCTGLCQLFVCPLEGTRARI